MLTYIRCRLLVGFARGGCCGVVKCSVDSFEKGEIRDDSVWYMIGVIKVLHEKNLEVDAGKVTWSSLSGVFMGNDLNFAVELVIRGLVILAFLTSD
ncbi:hypothetical protein Tco_0300867 [Tanacetum coccineum]